MLFISEHCGMEHEIRHSRVNSPTKIMYDGLPGWHGMARDDEAQWGSGATDYLETEKSPQYKLVFESYIPGTIANLVYETDSAFHCAFCVDHSLELPLNHSRGHVNENVCRPDLRRWARR